MKIFEVIDDLVIEAFSIHEIEEPQVHIKIEDDCDTLLILFAKEIRPLIAALTEAARVHDRGAKAAHPIPAPGQDSL